MTENTNILVVDDDVAMRFMVSEALDQAGYQVHEAGNGIEALDALHRLNYDIILLDVMMPQMDGYEFCQHLQSMEDKRHIPVLMMTGLDDLTAIHRAFEVGATDFISKPLNYTMLGYRVRYMLRTKATADLLRKNELLLTRAQSLAQLGHWEWQVGSDDVSCSAETIRIFGLENKTSRPSGLNPVIKLDASKSLSDVVQQGIEKHEAFQHEERYTPPNGQDKVLRYDIQVSTDVDNQVTRLMGTVQDITDIRNTEDEVRYLAYYDPVTGLLNRRFLLQYLQFNIDAARRQHHKLSLLFLDLDNFKRINDTMGHDVGDLLLQGVSKRLCQCVRSGDVVAYELGYVGGGKGRYVVEKEDENAVVRLGGDEFVVVLNSYKQVEDAAVVAERIIARLSEPFILNNKQVVVTTSIGISSFPADSLDVSAMLQNADTAMYHAKEQGKNRYQFFNNDIQERAIRRMSIETDLRKALELGDQMFLCYQPKMRLKQHGVVGVEALVRWNHPVKGVIPPLEFIELAEESGLIVPLGEWVFYHACQQAKAWESQGLKDLVMSVNVSARQFKSPDLHDSICRILDETELSPKLLELELTESLLMENVEESIKTMQKLKDLGLSISIDDFGTGYSSLDYITKFPIDTLKIDKSFVSDMEENPAHDSIVKATIALAHALKLKFVAEGIETKGQLDRLVELGCDEAQGYFFSEPLPADRFLQWACNYQCEAKTGKVIVSKSS